MHQGSLLICLALQVKTEQAQRMSLRMAEQRGLRQLPLEAQHGTLQSGTLIMIQVEEMVLRMLQMATIPEHG